MSWTTPITESGIVAIHAALLTLETGGVIVYFGEWSGGGVGRRATATTLGPSGRRRRVSPFFGTMLAAMPGTVDIRRSAAATCVWALCAAVAVVQYTSKVLLATRRWPSSPPKRAAPTTAARPLVARIALRQHGALRVPIIPPCPDHHPTLRAMRRSALPSQEQGIIGKEAILVEVEPKGPRLGDSCVRPSRQQQEQQR